jgi:hypothetical protein
MRKGDACRERSRDATTEHPKDVDFRSKESLTVSSDVCSVLSENALCENNEKQLFSKFGY